MNLVSMIGLPLLACVLLCLILGYLGLHVLKREVIFIDIAVAQIAALGALMAHIFIGVAPDSIPALLSGMGATLFAAFFFALTRNKASQIPIEAVIGITYALSASAALFLIGKGTGGHTHVQEMLSGGLLWVKTSELLWTSAVFAFVGACFGLFRKPFRRISDGYEDAVAAGMHVIVWDFLFYSLCGIVITLSVKLAGIVVTFCFLIIPATTSAIISTRWGIRLLIAWLAGIASSAAGLLFSQRMDFSAGVCVALFLGITLFACAVWKWTTRTR
ncbi:MAG: hypothetical protein A2283_18510 [Lentisphaerae bacterium RIFOXYA12_FULL_48_11]|nr:MAG: hypothetical protein A2283_18510 [Lentisphaerae bacterium RIFOXYA12_FULL_48_11]